MSGPGLAKFFVNHTIFASTIVWLLGSHFRDFFKIIVGMLIEPLVSLDLDQNGKPDLKELDNYVGIFMGRKFPLGRLLLELVEFFITLALVYMIVYFALTYAKIK